MGNENTKQLSRINTDFTPAGFLEFFFFFKPDKDDKYKVIIKITESNYAKNWFNRLEEENELPNGYFQPNKGYYKLKATSYYKPKVFSNTKRTPGQHLKKGEYVNLKISTKSGVDKNGKIYVFFDLKYITKINNKE